MAVTRHALHESRVQSSRRLRSGKVVSGTAAKQAVKVPHQARKHHARPSSSPAHTNNQHRDVSTATLADQGSHLTEGETLRLLDWEAYAHDRQNKKLSRCPTSATIMPPADNLRPRRARPSRWRRVTTMAPQDRASLSTIVPQLHQR
jgi:hypothetical protein